MKKIIFSLIFLILIVLNSHGQANEWTWMKGDNNSTVVDSSHPVYGPLGVSSSSFRPGTRSGATMWTSADGTIWLFGGSGYGNGLTYGQLNDLWKYNPVTNEWTWIKGDNTPNNFGVYTNPTASANKPGGRSQSVGWVDANGDFWLFGGYGYAASGTYSSLNDLWRYTVSTNTWTFIKGDNIIDVVGVYSNANTSLIKPGARYHSTGWRIGGNLYLFGGWGKATTASSGYLNDLWRYTIATNTWTWIKGDNTTYSPGVYSNPAPLLNKPGARESATSWIDANGIAWLFGGNGYAASANSGFLNDLWKYDATLNTWTWVKGDDVRNILGVYGSLGVPDVNNKPGSRHSAVGWADNAGNLWLFGGTTQFYLSDNDLWRYNILANTWTWMKGASYSGANGQYGIQGIPDDNNFPGARSGMSSVKDDAGNFWLFGGGGKGYPYNNSNVSLNELWKFNPVVNQWTWVRHNNEVEVYYPGNYGVQGNPDINNKPGGKSSSSYCSDGSGNYWLFGGLENAGFLNDLWKYNEASNVWTFMKGDSTPNRVAVYGTLGQPNSLNKPGSRTGSVMWKGGLDTLWLFGGSGYGNSEQGFLSDLWCYKISNNTWTWIKGDSAVNKDGIYNQAINLNRPGGRAGSVAWADAAGNLWLFGGSGYDNSGSGYPVYFNDLWKYNLSTNIWTFVKGDIIPDQPGIYGSIGVTDNNNKPGSRTSATTWVENNNLWLFGGYGNSENPVLGYLNDLWKYNIITNEWTWIKGDKNTYMPGNYGTIEIPGALNNPPSREGSIGWNDGEGNLWLFGGDGFLFWGIGGGGKMNDLWKYNIASNQWTWMKGDNTVDNLGEYGTITVSDINNKPGGRKEGASWKGSGSKIWLFGGYGYGSTNPPTYINDLWKYELPCSGQLLLTPLTGALCYSGSSVLLTVSGGTSYVWYKDGIVIPGQTGNTYTATTPGSYNVKGNVGSCLNVFSNEVFIQAPTIEPDLGGTGVYCTGQTVNVGIPQTEVGQDYTWLRDGLRVYGPLGGNGGNQSLQFPMATNSAGTYIVESTKPGCDTVFSNYVYVGFAGIEGLTITNLCPISSSSATVTFTWDRVGPSQLPQLYEYAVTLNPFPPAAGTVTSANTITRNISAGLTHRIYVRARCGADLTNFGEWAELIFQSPASVPTLAITPTSATICQGGSQLLTVTGTGPFQWYKDGIAINGETGATYLVTQAGGYSVRTILLNCETVFESNLVVVTISPPLTSTTNLSVCTNQLPYNWNGNNYSSAGTYNVTLIGSNGCDSIATLNLAINPTSSSITNVAVCFNLLPYNWNGNSYNAGGSYNVTLTGSNNCDSIATLNLSVNPVSTSTTTISICTNQLPYSWNGNNYNAGGIYNVTLPGTNGCDSIATLNLTVNTVLTSTTNASVCANQLPFVWNGNNYNTAGSFNVTLVSQSGCDSIATLNLTINPILSSTTNASTCTNQLPYIWNGNNYNAAGTYTITLLGSNGCDSIATLNLTINSTSSSITNVSTCSNQLPYSWNGNNYSSAGIYNVTLTGSNNCDSIATLNLSVNSVSTSTTNVSICTNQLPYNWNSNSYNAAGIYNVTLIAANGCDSIATLNLAVSTVLTSTTNASVCANQLPFVWNGNNYNTAGTFNVILVSQSGCDSIATLNLSVNPILTSTTNAAVCSNQLPYSWNGNNYSTAGTYNITLLGSNGCDSIATLNLSINSTSSSITNAAICSNQLPYNWNGNTYGSSGIYNVILIGTNGCDSIATLSLTVNAVQTSTTNVSICNNQLPYTWNGNNYNLAGIYNVTLAGSNGCDSIATLNLSIGAVLTSTTNVTICSNQLPFSWNGNNYTTAGSFNVTLVSQAGCDSIATLNLGVIPVLTSVTNITRCANQLPYLWNGNNYTATGIYNITLAGSNGCDSIASLNLTVNPVLTSITNASICANQTPYTWNGNNYSTSGIYTATLNGSNGCDSIATLNLDIKPILTSVSNIEICTNQLPYSWNGNNYNVGGSYNVTLAGSNGCDSIATLNLAIKPVATSTTSISICANQLPFNWNGNSYTAGGSYNVVLTGSNNCDSTATLILTVNALPTGSISPGNATICVGSSQILTVSGGVSYQWFLNGTPVNGATADALTVTTQGVYSVQLTAANGCKAMASNTANIQLLQKPIASFDFSAICQNETTIFNNRSTAGSSGTINWRWNFGDNSSSSLFAPTHVYTQPGSYTVELIATPAACLQLADTVKKTITVITATPGIRYDNVRVLKNTPYTLSARNIGVQYVWQPGTALNSSTIQNPVVTTTADRQYLVKITTAAGCLVTDTLLVQAFDKADIYVPKAFTPNNNNANDKLRPLGVSVFSIDYFRVYNRWGQLVYQTQTIGEGWDGNYKNVPQPTETYTWVFAGKSQDGTIIKASGKTVLIR